MLLTAERIAFNPRAKAGNLYIGTSTVDITPELPVALDGQMHLRIAEEIETPLEANIVVIEIGASAEDVRLTDSIVIK
ncbi:MAG: hypothetical protein ACOX19_12485 [Fermentimonas sp.]|jgi:hypothetical protein